MAELAESRAELVEPLAEPRADGKSGSQPLKQQYA